MSFRQLISDGATACANGATLLDNPFRRSESPPDGIAACYRAWQIKAETCERGWNRQNALSALPLRRRDYCQSFAL